MDIFDEEILKFWKALTEFDVQYIMVGGYTFDECLDMASVADIEDAKVPFLHINQLIENKRVVNRPKDQLMFWRLKKFED